MTRDRSAELRDEALAALKNANEADERSSMEYSHREAQVYATLALVEAVREVNRQLVHLERAVNRR